MKNPFKEANELFGEKIEGYLNLCIKKNYEKIKYIINKLHISHDVIEKTYAIPFTRKFLINLGFGFVITLKGFYARYEDDYTKIFIEKNSNEEPIVKYSLYTKDKKVEVDDGEIKQLIDIIGEAYEKPI